MLLALSALESPEGSSGTVSRANKDKDPNPNPIPDPNQNLSVNPNPGKDRNRIRRASVQALLLVGCAMSHEVTALFSAVLSLALALRSLASEGRDHPGFLAGLLGLLASIALEVWYWRRPYTPSEYLGSLPAGFVSYFDYQGTSAEVIGYLTAGFGLTLPLALLALFSLGSNGGSLGGKGKGKGFYTKLGLATLLMAGTSPLIAPYTSATTWYRFLIGAAPIASTLAAVGASRAVRDGRFHAAYALLILITGLAFTYGSNATHQYVSALREFPYGMHPSPSDARTLRDLEELVAWLRDQRLAFELNPKCTVAAEPSIARWVHLAIRNPAPGSLLWYNRIIAPWTIKDLFERSGVERLYAVSSFDLTEDEYGLNETFRIKRLREGIYGVYLIEMKREREGD